MISFYLHHPLLHHCFAFGCDNDILFNSSKSKLMLFNKDKFNLDNPGDLYLGQDLLLEVHSYQYLGHIVNCKLRDDDDIKSKRGILYARANNLVRNFYYCSDTIKQKLFNVYCRNIYMAAMWCNFSKSSMNSIKVAYNNAYRILFNLPWRCSASQMFVNSGVDNFSSYLRKCIHGIKGRVLRSDNCILSNITSSDIYFHSNLSRYWDVQIYSMFMI